MNKAFSLLETILALFIISSIFLFAYSNLAQILKNKALIHLSQKLFDEQKDLTNTHFKKINIQAKPFNTNKEFLEFKNTNSFFKLKSLKPSSQAYENFFYDEKSL